MAVIGLGRFGSSVARVCHELGYDVTAIDIKEERVAEAADYATLAAQADGSDEESLLSLGSIAPRWASSGRDRTSRRASAAH